jgi:hypothetical protein
MPGCGVQVFLDDSILVMHRHRVAGERHHLGASRAVDRVERRRFQIMFGGVGHVGLPKLWRRLAASRRRLFGAAGGGRAPPLSRDLKDSPRVPPCRNLCEKASRRHRRQPAGLHLRWGTGNLKFRPTVFPLPAFQSLISPRSGCLRVSGAVAPSAPARPNTRAGGSAGLSRRVQLRKLSNFSPKVLHARPSRSTEAGGSQRPPWALQPRHATIPRDRHLTVLACRVRLNSSSSRVSS